MTEEEYIALTNDVKLTQAIELIRDVFYFRQDDKSKDRHHAIRVLDKLLEAERSKYRTNVEDQGNE